MEPRPFAVSKSCRVTAQSLGQVTSRFLASSSTNQRFPRPLRFCGPRETFCETHIVLKKTPWDDGLFFCPTKIPNS